MADVQPPAPTPAQRWAPVGLTALALAIATIGTLAPLWPHLGERLLGDANADAVRGMWGLDFLRHSLLPPSNPVRSFHVNFPFGVVSFVLPWASGLLAAPLGALFGPVAGYNLAIALLVWGGGMATAWLGRCLTGSWAAGLVAGALLMSQPMLLHAVGDGTVEHVAIWAMAACLAATIHALRSRRPIWGAAAGALAAIVVLDSPYHAVYTAALGVIVLPWELGHAGVRRDRRRLLYTLAAAAVVAAIGMALIWAVYRYLPVSAGDAGLDVAVLRGTNATDPNQWLQYDFGPRGPRDPTLVPTLIPTLALVVVVALAAYGLPRSAAWLVAGLGLVLLSFGTNHALVYQLGVWFGGLGRGVGEAVVAVNGALLELPGLSVIRFPRRLLVPAAMALGVAAAFGVARARPRLGRAAPAVAAAVALLLVGVDVRASRLHAGFPLIELPSIAFADWIADQPAGAVVLLPQWRPNTRLENREDLPIFAGIEGPIASSDTLYVQVLHGKPQMTAPQLKTVRLYDRDAGVVRLVRDWNDLSLPLLQQRAIPPSAVDPSADGERATALAMLLERGLRYLVVDRTAYNDEGLAILRTQLGAHLREERAFDDGGGVVVLVLAP